MSSTDRKKSRVLKWEGLKAGIRDILVRKLPGKFPLGRQDAISMGLVRM